MGCDLLDEYSMEITLKIRLFLTYPVQFMDVKSVLQRKILVEIHVI